MHLPEVLMKSRSNHTRTHLTKNHCFETTLLALSHKSNFIEPTLRQFDPAISMCTRLFADCRAGFIRNPENGLCVTGVYSFLCAWDNPLVIW